MRKLWFASGLVLALTFTAAIVGAQEARTPLSKDDVLTLVELGVSEDEVARQIDARGATVDAAEIPALRDKVGAKVAAALERRCKPASQPLTKGELVRLIELRVGEDEIARLVAKRGIALDDAELAEVRAKLPAGSRLAEALAPKAARPAPLSKDDVVALTKQGTAPDEIAKRIEASDSRFELSTDELLALRRAGVDASVLKVMVARKGSPSRGGATRYVHPSYAFALERPAGWKTKTSHAAETLQLELQSDEGDALEVIVMPIADPEEWDDASLALTHHSFIEENFQAKPTSEVVQRIGTMTWKGFEGDASIKDRGAVKYRTFVGRSDEAVFFLNFFSKPERWSQSSATFEKIVASLAIPAVPEIRNPKGAPEIGANASNRALADRLKPSVVLVRVHDTQGVVGDAARHIGWGTGFIVHEDGWVLTNRHVVQEGSAGQAGRRLHDAFELRWDLELRREPVIADLVGVSERYDIACLKIRAPGPFQPAPLADVTQAHAGDRGIVLGFPRPDALGELQLNVNAGTISAVEKDSLGRTHWIRHVIQTDQGNSGGPLVDLEIGGVVGLHTQSVLVARGLGPGETPHATAWRAVPIHQAIREFPQIISAERESDLGEEDRVQRLAFYFGQKRYGSAALEARALLQSSPANVYALAYLARTLYEQGDRQQALDCLEQLLRKHDDDAFALKQAVALSIDLGQMDEARRWAKKLGELAKGDADACVLRALCEWKAGQHAAAIELLHEADKLSGGRAWSTLLNQALVIWEKAIADKQVYTAAGKNVLDPGVKERVERLCRRSLELRPRGNPDTWALLAEVARFENDLDKAIDYCKKGIESAPRSWSIRLKAARILLSDRQRGEDAIPFCQEALEIKETAHGYLLLGESFVNVLSKVRNAKDAAKCRDGALASLNRSLELSPSGPSSAECLFFLGLLHEKFGARDEAVNCYRRCLALKPEHVHVNEQMFKLAQDRVNALRGSPR